jgi:hypothetical protein
VWVIGMPEPSPIIMSSEPVYGVLLQGRIAKVRSNMVQSSIVQEPCWFNNQQHNVLVVAMVRLDEWMRLRSCWAS